MTVLSALRDQKVLEPSEVSQFPGLAEQLSEDQWQDVHLAAADIHLRRRLAARRPIEVPVQPSPTDTAMGLLTSDCGIYCLGGLAAPEHGDPRFDVFLFTGDAIKAGDALATDPEAFLTSLQDQAALVGRGLEALGIGFRDRALYLGLQPLIWASRAVANRGAEVVGRGTVEAAVDLLVARYLAGTTAGVAST
jgi:hypothetical protein